MKLVVLGAGALGSILAAHVAKSGGDVVLIARGARAELIRKHGIVIKGLASFTVPVTVTNRPQDLEAADVLIVAVKTYDTESALQAVRHLEVGSALSLQNGMLKDEQLAAAFGREHVLGAAANFSGEVTPEGAVHFTRNEGFHIGEIPRGTSGRVQALVKGLDSAGVYTLASQRIQTIEWSKFVAWLSLAPVSALSRLETHRLLQDPNLSLVMVRLAREAASIAGSLSVELEDLDTLTPVRTLTTLDLEAAAALLQRGGAAMQARGLTDHKVSILQDLERGRPLEVEETLGYTVRKAAELGIPVPALETCYRLLAGINRNLESARS